MRVHVCGRTGNGTRRQGDVQPVLNTVIARQITASFCTGDDVVCAESITGIGERNW